MRQGSRLHRSGREVIEPGSKGKSNLRFYPHELLYFVPVLCRQQICIRKVIVLDFKLANLFLLQMNMYRIESLPN